MLSPGLWQVGFLYVPVPCQHLKTVSTDGGVGRQHEPLETKHKLAALILVSVFLKEFRSKANPQPLEKVAKVFIVFRIIHLIIKVSYSSTDCPPIWLLLNRVNIQGMFFKVHIGNVLKKKRKTI